MNNKQKITVLLPVYNDWTSLAKLIPCLDRVFSKLNLAATIVIIDDGSTNYDDKDQLQQIQHLTAISSIIELTLVRNYGNQQALAIGLGYISKNIVSDLVLIMDSDFEDNPKDIPKLWQKYIAESGHKLIFAKRAKRSEGKLFRFCYKLYKSIFRLLTGSKISYGNFSLMSYKTANQIAHMPDTWNHYPAAIIRSKIPYCSVYCDRSKRIDGASTMNFTRLFGHAFNALAIFADVVAIRTLLFSMALVATAGVGGLLLVIFRFYTNLFMKGWSSIMLALFLLLTTQAIGFSVIINFIVAINRVKQPLIPSTAHSLFIQEIKKTEFAITEVAFAS